MGVIDRGSGIGVLVRVEGAVRCCSSSLLKCRSLAVPQDDAARGEVWICGGGHASFVVMLVGGRCAMRGAATGDGRYSGG
jgi:hypothetical protein